MKVLEKNLTVENRTHAQDGFVMSTLQRRPFAVWVIFGGLVFSASDLLYGIIPDLQRLSLFDPFLVLVAAFVVFCYLGALGVLLTQRRWSFVLSVVVSLGFVVPSLAVLPKPSDSTTYAIATSSIPVLVLVAIFSILCLINLKTGLNQKKFLASARSIGGALTVTILLLVIGGISFGIYSSSSSFVANTVTVSIIAGASNPSNAAGHFLPSSIVVVVGVNNTVTWINQDYTIHTVTSDSGLFSSGLLNHGDSWSYTFTTTGTFQYHCAIHPYMVGAVVVEDK